MSIWFFGGLAVLAAVLHAALQYLRIRPRKVRVITTLFWRQAADQAQARTLFEHFRHPRTYLLLLAVSLLLLLALAKPVFNTANQPHRVIVLEAGLVMTAADNRFDNALELTRDEAGALNEDRVAVIAADPHPRLIKHFDEPLATLEDRLARLNAADTPVIREDALQAARSMLAGRENGEVVLVSAQPATTGDAVRVLPAGEAINNAFVLSAVFVPDSADLTRGAFHCRVGFAGKQTGKAAVKVARADKPLLEQSVEFEPGQVKEFSVPGIAADGGVMIASIDADDPIAGDDTVEFQLPDRRRIQVVPAGGIDLPPRLTAVLDSLPEVTSEAGGSSNPSVIRVGHAGSDADILIPPADAVGELATVRPSDHPLAAELVFEDALCRAPSVPLNVEDGARPLLLAGGSAIAVLNPAADQLTVAATIFNQDASIARRTGYIVFWSNMLHHLAGWRNEPVTLSPVQASRSADAASMGLTLKAGMSNFDLSAGSEAAAPAESGVRLSVWQLLLVTALGLMVLEAILNIRGRIY